MAWDLEFEEGGGGLDGATGIVTDAYFAENEYGWSLVVVNKFDDPENYPKFEDGSFTRYFGCGKGWTSPDGGETITHETGDETKKLNKNSQAAQFAIRLAAIDGAQDALPDFSPYKAKSLKGAHLVWRNVPIQKRAPKVDEAGLRVLDAQGKEVWEDVPGATQLFPVALAGVKAASNGAGAVDVTKLGLTDEQINALTALGGEAGSKELFMAGLMGVDGVLSNKEFMSAVSTNLDGVYSSFSEPF